MRQETAANSSVPAPRTVALQLEQQVHTGGAGQIAAACVTLDAGWGDPVLIVCGLTKEVVP